MTQTRYDILIGRDDPAAACDVLARRTGISKTQIKQAMIKGAVWIKGAKSGERRLRRATAIVKPGDRLTFYHNPAILMLEPPRPECLTDLNDYSIWFKPAGLMTQGTRYGDHCSLTRLVEHHFKRKRKVYLVHRLDREARGVILVAHTSKAAALFAAMFRDRKVEKHYAVWVRGDLTRDSRPGCIDLPLDGKAARTDITAIRYDDSKDQSFVKVRIETGRLHQIRRHLEMIGHPVMGDPRYGRNNASPGGLQLTAYRLAFDCPFSGKRVEIKIDPQKM